MKNSEEANLKKALKKLEESSEKIVQTRGYTRESEKLRALSELIKEQLKSENLGHSTGSSR